ncbi:hypothetical protein PILCRDRAFT_585013 [Piloderma croceum F 1598]|uniref:Uncharacterized protein n=1 Tax=Piloderma croceum (strain F 1598) TaxID=765440 RepID=A0A0C3BMV1_PILCF|nr:hypothetical protein PILCRDRAFT_585013 [Piloderma croceum F 1598]
MDTAQRLVITSILVWLDQIYYARVLGSKKYCLSPRTPRYIDCQLGLTYMWSEFCRDSIELVITETEITWPKFGEASFRSLHEELAFPTAYLSLIFSATSITS